MATAAVDTAYLASSCSFPQTSLETLIAQPTQDLVALFLTNVLKLAQEKDHLKSENIRFDVELEATIRNDEVRHQTLKSSNEALVQENESLRLKINEEENSHAAISNELQTLRNDTSLSTTEVQSLQSKIEKLEKSNRDTLTVLELKSTSHDNLAQDLSGQHQKIVELRREYAELSERHQTVENELSSAKFRESSLQQEIQILKRNNNWLDSELKTKGAEFSAFRKDKGAKVAELQRANEDAASTITALQKTENSLRRRLEELGQKADDAFAKIQQLQEDAATAQDSFSAQLDNTRRLAELQKQSADTAKARVRELDDALDQTKADATEELAQLQAELETERDAKEAAEHKVEELEAQIEKLEADAQPQIPSTPRGNFNAPSTPGRTASPTPFTPNSSRARGGLSMTQMYTDYSAAKSALVTEQRRNEKLTGTIDEMIQALEKKEPEMQELRSEHARLEGEVTQLSTLLARSTQEKDTLRKESRKWQSQAEGLSNETQLLQQRLRDLSVQIKVLLVEVQTRTEGIELSPEERFHLRQSAAGGDSNDFEGMSDTGRFVSEHLVVFKSVFELQEQNKKLLDLTRQLGEQMEREEAKAKSVEFAEQKKEVETLRDRVERYKDEMKSLVTQSQSYIKERDMFRRMLSHRGQLPANADLESLFGNSVNGNGPPQTPKNTHLPTTQDQSPVSKELSDYSRLFKDLQNHFDAYRQEAATDHSALKEQVNNLARDKSDLQSQVARGASQLTLSHERYEMLQSNYNQLKSEFEDAQARSRSLAESAARQDIRTQQAAEELIEAKGFSESLRSELSNLKAERELWKRIETRMNEDNQSLTEERGRLNKLMADTQRMYHERDLADSETRRKLQTQVDSLTTELNLNKRKLEEEVTENKNLRNRREFDESQNRNRIDDLLKSLSGTKEQLIAAQTVRDQLQARVDDLKIDLHAAEERSQILQPKPTPRVQSEGQSGETTINHEQELLIEVADLKQELEHLKTECENYKVQVEQYKAISQSSEEELQSLNDASEQYRTEMDKLIEDRDATIRGLQDLVEGTSAELAAANTKLMELETVSQEHATRLGQQKSFYEANVKTIEDERDRYKETAEFRLNDLKEQSNIAQTAQHRYDEEVVRHAEARQAVQQLRSNYNAIKLEAAQAKADAEAAKTSLAQTDESWQSLREKYETELADLRARKDDISAQNGILHKQLDNFSTQLNSLQQTRSSVGEVLPGEAGESGIQNFQEVIKYLRREKEIVDIQYELSDQEVRRLKQQLDYTITQLDEARLKIDQERNRQADSERNSISQTKLMETINELNVFRESSVTLRNETKQAQNQLAEKSKQVEDLLQQIQPLQANVRELSLDKENIQGDLKLLQDDRDHWRARTQQILQKYDRIDPAELEGLKEQIDSSNKQRDEAIATSAALQAQVDELPAMIKKETEDIQTANETRRLKLIDQFKARSRELSTKIKNSENEIKTLTEQLESTKKELEITNAAKDEALAQVPILQAQVQNQESSRSNNDQEVVEDGQVEETNANNTDNDNQIALSIAQKELEESRKRADQLQSRTLALETAVTSLEQQLADSNTQLAQARAEVAPSTASQSNATLDKLKAELLSAQNEVETLRKASTENAEPTSVADTDITALRAELERERDEKVKEAEEAFNKKREDMKRQLNTKLQEGRAKIREDFGKAHEEELAKLKEEHQSAIAALEAEHKVQLDEAKAQNTAEMESLKAKLATQETNSTATQPPQDPVPAQTTEVSTLSDAEIKEILQHNAVARGIMLRSIKNKLEQETTKLKSEHEKQVAELQHEHDLKLEKVSKEEELKLTEKTTEMQQAAEKAKEHAVVMANKKWEVKFSMAEGKARTAGAKLEVVTKAATETPQMPVAEVWAVAKAAKAASVLPPKPSTPQATPSVKPQSPAQSQTVTSQSQTQIKIDESEAESPKGTPNNFTTNGATTSIPAGTGPAALRGLHTQGSAIPRGGGIPRGSRGGPARGGRQVSATNAQQGQIRGGHTSNANRGGTNIPAIGRGGHIMNAGAMNVGPMNAGAKQFVPGNKRPREDSSGGNDGNKRPKGEEGAD